MGIPDAIKRGADLADDIEGKLNAEGTVTEHDAVGTTHVDEQPDEVEKLRSKYASLQGKYNAELPRAVREAQELKEQLAVLQAENEELKQFTEVEPEPLIKEQDVEIFGEDMIDLVKRGASEATAETSQRTRDLEYQVSELRTRLAQNDEASREARRGLFFQQLTAQLPDWEDQNVDDGFLAWLDTIDPMFGLPRKAGLEKALSDMDASRVVNIFVQYRKDLQRTHGNSLARQVTPDTRRGVGGVASSKKVFTQAQIKAFYDDAVRGKYSKEDVARIEEEINSAVAEGRIVS